METEPREHVTDLLRDWSSGIEAAEEPLARAVQFELLRMAENFMRSENTAHTLEPAALVNEAYLRLKKQNRVAWKNRGHFFAIAAKVMRRVLLDHAKGKHRLKRGGDAIRLSFDESLDAPEVGDFSQLHDALDELEKIGPRKAAVVELRFFGGLEMQEVAELLGCSPSSVARDWRFARAFLMRSLA